MVMQSVGNGDGMDLMLSLVQKKAVCNNKHRCECIPYFVEVEQECVASYDAICSSSKDCNQLEFLICGKSGKCECRPGTVRHLKANTLCCYVKIGGKSFSYKR